MILHTVKLIITLAEQGVYPGDFAWGPFGGGGGEKVEGRRCNVGGSGWVMT